MYARLLIVTALAALVAVPASAQVKKSEMPGIRNYSRVDATVGCGGAVDPSAMSARSFEKIGLETLQPQHAAVYTHSSQR